MSWFRAYEEALNDPKIQRLPDAVFKTWFNLLCLASLHDGFLPETNEIAFALRLSEEKCAERLSLLIKAELIDETETGLSPHNWNGRQYKSDVSTGRVKQFRKRQRNVSSAVSETPPDTDTDTEQKSKKGSEDKSSGADAPAGNGLFDARTDLFQGGLSELCRLTGKPQSACRSLVGKWLQQTKDDASQVRLAIHKAAENRVAEPVAWIEKSLRYAEQNDPYRGAI